MSDSEFKGFRTFGLSNKGQLLTCIRTPCPDVVWIVTLPAVLAPARTSPLIFSNMVLSTTWHAPLAFGEASSGPELCPFCFLLCNVAQKRDWHSECPVSEVVIANS